MVQKEKAGNVDMMTQTNQKMTSQKVKSVKNVKQLDLEGQSSGCAVTCVDGTMLDSQTLPQMLTLKQLSGFVTAVTNPCDFANHTHS